MKIQPKDKRALLAAALGKTGCDLAVKNAQYVNLFTGEIYPATVFVHQGFVVHVENKNLEEGLEKAKQEEPDLIILDLMMPRSHRGFRRRILNLL